MISDEALDTLQLGCGNIEAQEGIGVGVIGAAGGVVGVGAEILQTPVASHVPDWLLIVHVAPLSTI